MIRPTRHILRRSGCAASNASIAIDWIANYLVSDGDVLKRRRVRPNAEVSRAEFGEIAMSREAKHRA